MASLDFSLIVATVNRTAELEKLFESFCAQATWNFEILVVDQNLDNRVETIVHAWRARYASRSQGEFPENRLRHIRCRPGLSRARNAALPLCFGDILAFPDDDCWYPPQTLLHVAHWFGEHRDYQILSLSSKNEAGELSGNRWPIDSCDLSPINIFRTSISYSFFVKNPRGRVPLRFDESLGVGSTTRFGSGEDTDFVLSLLKSGMKGKFQSKWCIGHPRKDVMGGRVSKERSRSYGMGMGRVIRKQSLGFLFVPFLLLDIVRGGVAFLLGKSLPASLWFAHGCGIAAGYFATPPTPLLMREAER